MATGSTPLQSFLGGIGLALPVHTLLMLNGSVFGIAGFLHRAVKGGMEDAASVLGLLLGGIVVGAIEGPGPQMSEASSSTMIASGVLVGLGTKLSNGCTSGHMICGLSRLSPRSIVATATFFITGVLTTHVLHGSRLIAAGPADYTLGDHGSTFMIGSSVSMLSALVVQYLLSPPDSVDAPKIYNETYSHRRIVTSFLTAMSFSLALRLSNLTSPQRVLSFLILPFNSSFDPSLAFLAVGALPLASALYRKWGRGLCPKTSAKVDWRLVTGAAVFGVGWGMEGICPGPGLVNFGRALATSSNIQPLAIWLVSVLVGGLLVA